MRPILAPLLADFARAGDATAYDRFVAVMRLVLPLAALAVGAAALLWPLVNEREASFTLSREELVKRDDTIRVLGARYAGRDRTGKRFEVKAVEALQNTPAARRVRIDGLEARMTLSDDNAARVHAARGLYALDDHVLDAEGGVRLTTTDGMRVDTAGATVDLPAKTARSAGPVTGSSRLGRFEAGAAVLTAEDRVLRLDGGVTMRILPDQVSRPAPGDQAPPEDRTRPEDQAPTDEKTPTDDKVPAEDGTP
ncbi:hypothetical protein CCR85_12090 [Rhodothalassium salexigens]|uniref:LPS export ABC transporter periplasmic protein LptC n=1 Tax=Rhodothalassium salexigens TaxID=1086 RepID=UPI0019133174|nr:LPS export ABC transporter periplasmic protein LptC [Rhodothalassium salexigens]MBK5912230.1 hypothetical protein [Rhodothalassium salexigens]